MSVTPLPGTATSATVNEVVGAFHCQSEHGHWHWHPKPRGLISPPSVLKSIVAMPSGPGRLFRAPDQSADFRGLYAPTHLRAAPYMVGLLAGYVFQRQALRQKEERFTQVTNVTEHHSVTEIVVQTSTTGHIVISRSSPSRVKCLERPVWTFDRSSIFALRALPGCCAWAACC